MKVQKYKKGLGCKGSILNIRDKLTFCPRKALNDKIIKRPAINVEYI